MASAWQFTIISLTFRAGPLEAVHRGAQQWGAETSPTLELLCLLLGLTPGEGSFSACFLLQNWSPLNSPVTAGHSFYFGKSCALKPRIEQILSLAF